MAADKLAEDLKRRVGDLLFRRRTVPDRHGCRTQSRHAGSKANVTDDDATVIAKIARARVNGFPDHYSRPAVVEADREGYWARGSSTRPK